MRRFDRTREYLGTSLWVVPAVGAVLAVAAALAAVALDRSTHSQLGFSGGAQGARSALSTIAAAMITFTGLVFSITIVALQLASGQFSPRVMRTLLRDRTSKLAMATFVATFSFAFTVMRATRDGAVPGIAVSISILLVFASVGVFIHYINHIAHAIRASSIIEAVAAETRTCIDRVHPLRSAAPDAVATPEIGSAGPGRTVHNRREPGVVTGVDIERIVARARAADTVVVLRTGVGGFVPHDAALLDLYGTDVESCDVVACVSLARERTMQQDVSFGFRQLVDLAIKALSPGINDPTTAVQALDQIHDLMRRLAPRPMAPGRAVDSAGTVRLVYPSPSWESIVALALDEIRIYGAGSLQVHVRMRSLLEDVMSITTLHERRRPLLAQLELLDLASKRCFPDAHDRVSARAGAGACQG